MASAPYEATAGKAAYLTLCLAPEISNNKRLTAEAEKCRVPAIYRTWDYIGALVLQQVHRRQSSIAGANAESRESTLEAGSGKYRLLLKFAIIGGSNEHWR